MAGKDDRERKKQSFHRVLGFRTAIDSLSEDSSELTIATETSQTYQRRILIVCLWFFSTLVAAIFLPNISVAIHYLGALAASFIFIFPG